MDHTVTASVKGLLVTAVGLLALLAAYLLGSVVGTAPPPAQAAPLTAAPAEERPRTLRMVGSGEATVVPDQLSFTLSVTARRPDLDDALGRTSATTRRVLAALRGQGVRDADVQTTGLQMYPEYDYPSYGPPVLIGYRVTQRARVVVREIADGGEGVSTAVATGGNGVRVTDIRLGVADPEAALAKARDAAVEAATAKAEQYAAATGQSLGEVLALREVTDGGGSSRSRDLGPVSARATYDMQTVPIEAGRDELAVKVAVEWSFE